jgi:hypothetical protein
MLKLQNYYKLLKVKKDYDEIKKNKKRQDLWCNYSTNQIDRKKKLLDTRLQDTSRLWAKV